MKDIMLRIIGSRLMGIDAIADDDAMEFITEGRLERKGDALYLIYDESELSGMDGCTTSLKITGEKVHMRRYGESLGMRAGIDFEKGKKWGGFYETPFGPIPMEVLTNEIVNSIDPDTAKGSVGIDCSVALKGLAESRNILKFEIM